MRNKFQQRSTENRALIGQFMFNSSRHVWRCDPDVHEEIKTFEELTLFKGYIENEIDLNSLNSCGNQCTDYKSTKTHSCTDNNNNRAFCAYQPNCSGRIVDCQFIEDVIHVCISVNIKEGLTQERMKQLNIFRLQKVFTKRRYEFMVDGKGSRYGLKKNCHQNMTRAKTWTAGLIFTDACHYCMCLCEEPDGDKYFSMRPVLSDYENN